MTAPRIPRHTQLSVAQAALSLVLLLIVLGFLAAATFLWPVAQRMFEGLWTRSLM